MPSLGTGFVISPDGYIATNNHVIEDVDKIEVHFLDGEKLEAEIVGRDPSTDVALIRVKPDEGAPVPAARRLGRACARATGCSPSAIPSASSTP